MTCSVSFIHLLGNFFGFCSFVFDFLNYASYDETILNAFEAHAVYGIGQGVEQIQEVDKVTTDQVSHQHLSRQQRRRKDRIEGNDVPRSGNNKPVRSIKGFK